MDKEFAAEWVKALRSGKSQAIGVLHQKPDSVMQIEEGYCCLGVACEVAFQQGKTIRRVHHGLWEYGVGVNKGTSYVLPLDVAEVMGVSEDFRDTGQFNHDPEMVAWWENNPEAVEAYTKLDEDGEPDPMPQGLAGMNDRGVPFAIIADFVEKFADRL